MEVLDSATFAGPPLRDAEEQAIHRIIDSYQGHLLSWKVLPNHSSVDLNQPPQGATVVFGPDAPLQMDPFNDGWFSGTSVVQITAIDGQEPEMAGESHLLNPQNDFMKRLMDSAPQTSSESPFLGAVSVDSQNDLQTWKPELGDHGSYVGIYTSVFRSDNERKRAYFLVCQTSASSVGYQFQEALEDAQHQTRLDENGAISIRSFFENNDLYNV